MAYPSTAIPGPSRSQPRTWSKLGLCSGSSSQQEVITRRATEGIESGTSGRWLRDSRYLSAGRGIGQQVTER